MQVMGKSVGHRYYPPSLCIVMAGSDNVVVAAASYIVSIYICKKTFY
jgi:hypothetical protein